MLDKDIVKKNNVSAAYAKINSHYEDPGKKYENLLTWLNYESNEILELHKNIKLHVISSEMFEEYNIYLRYFKITLNL
jgi:hypothetical protein